MEKRILQCILVAMTCASAWAADHKEAPLVSERPPSDIADLYVFLSPSNSDNLVMVMTVNPFVVQEAGGGFNFSPEISYIFNVDNTGDAIADTYIKVDFEKDQSFELTMPNGVKILGQATPATAGTDAVAPVVASDSGISVFAGPRDDPFFFDFVGFNRVLGGLGGFTGLDSFAGYNVSAIVVEAPAEMFGADVLNVWATTEVVFTPFKNGESSKKAFSRQLDRMGNPAVSTALIPSNLKDRFNQVSPSRDASEFAGEIVASLQALGTSDENIGILASVAVPDVLTIDVTQPSGFPNGRGLADDVIDTIFLFVFNNTGVSDGVDANDLEFSDTFPYLAAPWQPE